MEKELGHITKITIKIDSPMQLNFTEIEFNKLSIFTGTNGSGKSLILKFNWLCSTFINLLIAKNGIKEGISVDNTQLFEYLFKNTFVDNNFNGYIRCFYPNNSLSVAFTNGSINSLVIDGDLDLNSYSITQFLSKETRTFDSVDKYLQLKKLLNVGSDILDMAKSENSEKLLSMYRIYDIFFIEGFINKTKDGFIIEEKYKEDLTKFGIECHEIKTDFNNSAVLFKKTKDTEFIRAASLSSGEQSILTMFLASIN